MVLWDATIFCNNSYITQHASQTSTYSISTCLGRNTRWNETGTYLTRRISFNRMVALNVSGLYRRLIYTPVVEEIVSMSYLSHSVAMSHRTIHLNHSRTGSYLLVLEISVAFDDGPRWSAIRHTMTLRAPCSLRCRLRQRRLRHRSLLTQRFTPDGFWQLRRPFVIILQSCYKR